MLPIIQGNDAIISVILHQQAIRLASSPADTAIESHKIDLSRVKELSVRLIPYMRWDDVSPEFSFRDNVIEVSFPASSQKPGKWDIEISYFTPSDDGGYKRQRVKQDFAEVIPAYERAPGAMTSAYIVTAEVTPAMRGETGLDAYQSAKARGLVKSYEEWIEYIRGPQGIKGDTGKDAYAIYLETTKDNPPLSREQWANLNDFLLQLLFRLIKGREAQLTADDMTADLILELERLRRGMASALRSYRVEVSDDDGLDKMLQIIQEGVVPPILIYKGDQFYLSPNERFPKMEVFDGGTPTMYCLFQKAVRMKAFPEILGVHRTTSIQRMCEGASELAGEVSLPNMPRCLDAGGVFQGCRKLERAVVGNMPENTTLVNFCQGCKSMTYAKIGDSPKCVSIQNLFENCEAIEEVELGDLGKPRECNYVFNGCTSLRVVRGVPLDFSEATNTNSVFNLCSSLENVRVRGLASSVYMQWCGKLSVDSVRYMVDNAHNVGGATISLSNRLFDEHRDEMEAIGRQATAKGFTITYR